MKFHDASSLCSTLLLLFLTKINRASSQDESITDDVADFTIKEGDTESFSLSPEVTQNILSPSYPAEMSTHSQDITCTFTRPLPVAGRTTRAHVEVKQLQLHDSAEIFAITSDSNAGTRRDFAGPIIVQETNSAAQRTFNYEVTNNFTLHFNRCTTRPPGGRFMVAFKVESDFEVTCTHIFTQCELAVTPPPPLPGPDHIDPTDKPDNIGLIVGAIIGGLLLLILLLVIIIVILFFIIRKRRKNQDLPVEKRDKQHPSVARYSSYGDRTSNIYLEIADNDPSVHYYSEIGRINSALGKKKTDYDNRPPPEIPHKPNGVASTGANNNDPGYDKIKEFKSKGSGEDLGKIGNDYSTPGREISYEKIGDVEDKDDSEDSYSKLMNPGKKVTFEEQEDDGDIKDGYAKPNKKSVPDNNDNKEGVDVEPHSVDFKRLNSEVIMQDNTDIYIPAEEAEGIKAEHENTTIDTPKGNNESPNSEEMKWHENNELYGSKC